MDSSGLRTPQHPDHAMHDILADLFGDALGQQTSAIALERFDHQYNWTYWNYHLRGISDL